MCLETLLPHMQALQGLDSMTHYLRLANPFQKPKVNKQTNKQVKNETHVQQASVYINLDWTSSFRYKWKQNVNIKTIRQ